MDPNFPPLRDPSYIHIDYPVRLCRNRVVLKKIHVERSATLWTPREQLPMTGIVLAVGPGEKSERTGFCWPNYVHVGQRIIVSPHDGVEVIWHGEPALIVREDEVLAVFDEPGKVCPAEEPLPLSEWPEPEGWRDGRGK